jgi:hypothetical protein
MPPSRISIDPGLVRQLYVDEGFPTAEVAMKLGCAGATILRRLRQLGMDVRPRGPVRRRRVDGGITWSPQIAYALGLMATDGKAVRFLAPLGYASARSVGRPRVGWLYTVPASGE